MRTYPERPWLAIGVVVHRNNDILLIKRGKEPNKGKWSLPGGAQKVGETVFAAAKREVLEETGVEVMNFDIIDVVDSIHHDEEGRVLYHYTLIEVSCCYDKGILQAADDAEQAQWVCYDDLDHFDLMPKTIQIITKSYLSRKASLTDE